MKTQSLFKRIKYRVWQGIEALCGDYSQEEWETAASIIPKEIKKILDKHSKDEKAHLLRVYKKVKEDEVFYKENLELYLKLALVHDIAKAAYPVNIFIKVLKVLLGHDFTHHAQRGAQLLEKLGGETKLVELVERHHMATKEPLMARFQEYDDES